MDSLLAFVLQLYRLAQDTPVAEFPDLALEMLKAVVLFRSATWSEAEVTPTNALAIFSVHLHNEPDEVRFKFSSLNQKHTRRVMVAAQQPGQASLTNDTLAAFSDREEAPMRAYMKEYGHHRNVLITDLSQWLSLYRVYPDGEYTERDGATLNALMPHLFEALSINRALTVGDTLVTQRPQRAVGVRALIDLNGIFLHCGRSFLELLRREWRDWSEPRIPSSLLSELRRDARARLGGGCVEISAQPFGAAMLLTGRQVSPFERLSPRELEIAREFGDGKSHKVIARDLQLAPATVRNVLQKTYRKLDIDNKAALARLLELERR